MLVRLDNIVKNDGPISRERALWCAVIQQAWDDYFTRSSLIVELPEDARSKNGKIKRDVKIEHTREAKRNRHEAKSFLFDTVGGWAQSRAHRCALAGIDPDWLREQALIKARERR